jgi:hypothetical protein
VVKALLFVAADASARPTNCEWYPCCSVAPKFGKSALFLERHLRVDLRKKTSQQLHEEMHKLAAGILARG